MYGNGRRGDAAYNTICKFSIPVDVNSVRNNGTVRSADSVVNELQFDMGNKRYLFKNDLALLSIIAANNWNGLFCLRRTVILRTWP